MCVYLGCRPQVELEITPATDQDMLDKSVLPSQSGMPLSNKERNKWDNKVPQILLPHYDQL